MFEALSALVLVTLLAIAGLLVFRLRSLSGEARAMRTEIAEIRAQQAASSSDTIHTPQPTAPTRPVPIPPLPDALPEAKPEAKPDLAVAEGPGDAFGMQAPALPSLGALRQGATRRAPQAAQPSLPLPPDPADTAPPLPLEVLISALQFPETEDDTEGFRALRRALRDHKAGQLIQAAQDVLTLLSQDGLYMDDLPPDQARPEIWRRFAEGERGGPVAALGGVRDRGALALAAKRLREDAVFRDATHHFLRRFDKMLGDVVPEASDQNIVRLSDTRTARAFMLLGKCMGVFD